MEHEQEDEILIAFVLPGSIDGVLGFQGSREAVVIPPLDLDAYVLVGLALNGPWVRQLVRPRGTR